MNECRVVDLKELGVSKEVFDKIYSMGEQDGRADKYREITSEYMLLTEKQVADIREDAIDEAIIEILKLDYGVMTKDELYYKVCDLLVKLKERSSE